MKLLIIFTCTLLALSACVVRPYGRGYGYYDDGDRYHQDYGRRVWHD